MNVERAICLGCLVVTMLLSPTWSQTSRPASQPTTRSPDFHVESGPALDKQGLTTWVISSPYQEGNAPVEILVPDDATKETKTRFPVIYFLQVGPGFGGWGNPIVEAKNLNLHNKHNVIFVLPAFNAVKREYTRGSGPWYADHPTDPLIRHESYLVKAIVPFIEQHYPALSEPRGRLLLGFSMSGCGAFYLLMHHPDVFGRALAWDSPSSWTWWQPEPRQKPNPFSYGPWLFAQNAEMLKTTGNRLVVVGYDVYRRDTESVHKQLLSLGIPHDYDNDTRHKHGWNSGWLDPAVEMLVK